MKSRTRPRPKRPRSGPATAGETRRAGGAERIQAKPAAACARTMRPTARPGAVSDVARSATALAPAKVNLTLRIVGRRADGYHDLESLVACAPFGDRLTLRIGPP